MTNTQTPSEAVEFLRRARLAVIIRLAAMPDPLALAEALVAGGVKVLEFTLNTPGALDAITKVKHAFPDIAVGAGTVLSADDARAALDAGAAFLISPSLRVEVIEIAKQANVMAIPGAFTATEIDTAWSLGADVVKVFPARAVGAKYLKEIAGPFPYISLMPTGGITLDMVPDFLAYGAVAVGVGGVIQPQAVAAGDWAAVTASARDYVAKTQ